MTPAPATMALAGGGTGGHLFPGIAVASTFLPPGERPILFGSGKAIERRWVGEAADRVAFDAPKLPGGPREIPGFCVRLARAFEVSLRVMRARRTGLVVGLGGYASVAPGLAALLTGRPLLLLEQNAVPGIANRVLSRLGGHLAASFAASLEALTPQARGRARVLGNPVRKELLAGVRDARRFSLSPDRPILLVTGGSQGAGILNEVVLSAAPALAAAGIQLLHLTGVADEARVREGLDRAGATAFVASFSDEMGSLYRTADLVLCRAGGTTLAELGVLGRPSLLVPYVLHADRHQERNADVFVRAGAARAIPERELTPERLAREASELFSRSEELARMAAAARGLGVPDAARRVADWARELLAGGRRAG
jgi:UDP-N-acetylglucosamine--N-acetylmuramyl-(pentapeptide) pyrophosphoryl-undecaprenol N-acetylglucosamine transferase